MCPRSLFKSVSGTESPERVLHPGELIMAPLETMSERAAATPPAPQRAVVFFDGVCGLCNGFVNFLLDHDPQGKLLFAPLQGETAAEVLDPKDTQNLHTVIFRKGDQYWRKSSAIVRIYWELGGPWSAVGLLLWLIPKPLRDCGYSLVARYRYRLFGKHESCRMPRPGEAERMLP